MHAMQLAESIDRRGTHEVLGLTAEIYFVYDVQMYNRCARNYYI